jgi:sugar-specific transcriptional regulator TrmB
MSNQELVIKALMSLGLSEKDVRTYIFLAKRGPQRCEDIAEALNMGVKQVYVCLWKLQDKGIVKVAVEPACFLAVPFDKVVDLLVKNRKQQAKNIQQIKGEILQKWQSKLLEEDDT